MAAVLSASPVAAQVAYAPQSLPEPGASICSGGLCQPEALDGVFEGLAGLEAGTRARPVHILQIGDSHTAGDRITGALRARLQGRFGNGGRGVLPPGVPWAGYAPFQVEATATGWDLSLAVLVPRGGYGQADVGLAGARSISAATDGTLTLVFDPGAEPAWIGACAGPGDGALTIASDRTGLALPLIAEAGRPVCSGADLGGPTGRLTLGGEGARRLQDLYVTTGRPGVIVSNLGVVGATVRDLAARDDAVARAQLAFWRPDLIVLAFGTNEGFEDDLDAAAYEALLRGQVARMRRLAPGAAVMILGAPDALRSGAAEGCSADGRRAPPPSLAVVRDVQRRVAADMGVAFWDWHGRMGGDCSAERLATMAPAMMRGDRVHFSSEGADWIGGVLADDLMAAYAAWRGGRGL